MARRGPLGPWLDIIAASMAAADRVNMREDDGSIRETRQTRHLVPWLSWLPDASIAAAHNVTIPSFRK